MSYEISPVGNFLLYKKEYNPSMVKEIIVKNNLNGLRVFDHSMQRPLDNFEFLKDYAFLEGLEIATCNDYNYDFLHYLEKLKHLNIQNEGTSQIDLSSQINLIKLSIQWRKNVVGIDKCLNLESLGLVGFKESDLKKIQALINLKRLKIATSSLKSLEHINELRQLKHLILGNCKSLQTIHFINGLTSLQSLELDTCPKVEDLSLLNNLPNLKKIRILDCKQVPSIKFLENLKLDELELLGNTDVTDGDLKPALSIKDVAYKHRSHYNVKIENKRLENLLAENKKKLNDFFKNNL